MIWKAVFWLYSVPLMFLVILASLDVKWHFVDWLSIAAVAIGVFILYLYAYGKNPWPGRFRYFIVALIIMYWVAYIFYLDPHTGAYPNEGGADAIFNIIIVLPIFAADVLYARKRRK